MFIIFWGRNTIIYDLEVKDETLRGQQTCSNLHNLKTSDPEPHSELVIANLLLHLLYCVTCRNRSRQVRSISTRYSLKRNFMVGQIKQKNQNIFLFPMFYFETKFSLLTAALYLVFISNTNVFLNKSLNLFLVHHLNWINDFRCLPLTPAETGQ